MFSSLETCLEWSSGNDSAIFIYEAVSEVIL